MASSSFDSFPSLYYTYEFTGVTVILQGGVNAMQTSNRTSSVAPSNSEVLQCYKHCGAT